ncbi:hypothetical protein AGABI2DRAFT_73401 [Agaricus bisporus var. bisporus H97]|uniref:hypothetical protein n=1 Tax=Agaricus bisporus var. bisporus (strain H97 / ATCC MYA-4626 / FGSC 10389) TaxID=936046 RepID=UPI00029F602A|nr:hypothetical protein AGABI2DRAFT_73401 [Agaricus bisporus var. bisporus H97]EKV44869.1 hypothetical protein AGABI2DRAFT_73401 [Agaricus bisporus var. bisporus H97]
MEHILTQCETPGQKEIWNEIAKIWRLRHNTWQKPTFGEIMGCASARITNNDGKTNIGLTRLYQILISEAAYKIWSIRCKRVIGDDNNREKWPRNEHIVANIYNQINLRLRIDCLHTNESKFGKKAISIDKVKATWKDTLKDEIFLPDNWAYSPGVLVGIRQSEPHTA